MREFRTITRSTNVPIILLFTKLDILIEHIQAHPISSHFPSYQGGSDYNKACDYFADLFQALDRRNQGELHIYFTNAVDSTSFEEIIRDIYTNVLSHVSKRSAGLARSAFRIAPKAGRVDRRQRLSMQVNRQYDITSSSSSVSVNEPYSPDKELMRSASV